MGVNTATVFTNQTFIVVKFDYLNYSKNKNPHKMKQKLQNSTEAMFFINKITFLYYNSSWRCLVNLLGDVASHSVDHLRKGVIVIFLQTPRQQLVDSSQTVGWPLKMTARHNLLWAFEDMYTPQTTGSSLKPYFFVYWGLIMTKLHDFSNLVYYRSYKVEWFFISNDFRPSGAGEGMGEEGQRGRLPPQNFLSMYPFFLMSPLNVLFLKEVTQHIHENQQAKSRAN